MYSRHLYMYVLYVWAFVHYTLSMCYQVKTATREKVRYIWDKGFNHIRKVIFQGTSLQHNCHCYCQLLLYTVCQTVVKRYMSATTHGVTSFLRLLYRNYFSSVIKLYALRYGRKNYCMFQIIITKSIHCTIRGITFNKNL